MFTSPPRGQSIKALRCRRNCRRRSDTRRQRKRNRRGMVVLRRRAVATETPMSCPPWVLLELQLTQQNPLLGRLLSLFRFHLPLRRRTRPTRPSRMVLEASSSPRKRTVGLATLSSRFTLRTIPVSTQEEVPATGCTLVTLRFVPNIPCSIIISMLWGIRPEPPKEVALPCPQAAGPTRLRSFELPLEPHTIIRCRHRRRTILFPWKAILISLTWIHRLGPFRRPESSNPLLPRDILLVAPRLEMPRIHLL